MDEVHWWKFSVFSKMFNQYALTNFIIKNSFLKVFSDVFALLGGFRILFM